MKKTNREEYKRSRAVFSIKEINSPWREVLHLGERKSIPRNSDISIIYNDLFFFLDHGTVRLTGISEDGHERVVMIMEEGVIFGEATFLHKTPDHLHAIKTLSPCEVIAFPKQLLEDEEFCKQYPHLILNLVRSLGIKVGALFSQIYDTNLFDIKRQICRMMAQLWREQGEGRNINPNLSQTDVAHLLGVHRSSVCRIIRELRDQGVIGHFSKTRLEINNAEELLALGDLICLIPQ